MAGRPKSLNRDPDPARFFAQHLPGEGAQPGHQGHPPRPRVSKLDAVLTRKLPPRHQCGIEQ